ncbi:MAG: hypothetical protein ABIP03_02740 [Aquihabitans sp.]
MTATAGAGLESAPARRRKDLASLAATTATIAESMARIVAAGLALHALRASRACPGNKR